MNPQDAAKHVHLDDQQEAANRMAGRQMGAMFKGLLEEGIAPHAACLMVGTYRAHLEFQIYAQVWSTNEGEG